MSVYIAVKEYFMHSTLVENSPQSSIRPFEITTCQVNLWISQTKIWIRILAFQLQKL